MSNESRGLRIFGSEHNASEKHTQSISVFLESNKFFKKALLHLKYSRWIHSLNIFWLAPRSGLVFPTPVLFWTLKPHSNLLRTLTTTFEPIKTNDKVNNQQ